MRRINGYAIAARLCEISGNGTNLSFPELCKIFGPIYWESLPSLSKLYFKRLAIHYKQTSMGKAEKAGFKPSCEEFLTSLFGHRNQEQETVMQELKLVCDKILNTGETVEDVSM